MNDCVLKCWVRRFCGFQSAIFRRLVIPGFLSCESMFVCLCVSRSVWPSNEHTKPRSVTDHCSALRALHDVSALSALFLRSEQWMCKSATEWDVTSLAHAIETNRRYVSHICNPIPCQCRQRTACWNNRNYRSLRIHRICVHRRSTDSQMLTAELLTSVMAGMVFCVANSVTLWLTRKAKPNVFDVWSMVRRLIDG